VSSDADRLERYARPEQERRWLVRRLPDLSEAAEAHRIDDRYLAGTRLRLRSVTPLSGGPARHKLGQKVRPDPANPRLVMHTTMYLTADEHQRLSRLPGATLRKVRHVLARDGRRFGVDVFDGRHAGLALVEVELSGPAQVPAPEFAGPEVTGDERFTGGWLATAPADALAAVLAVPR
jgi:CYTH domain-containing protein